MQHWALLSNQLFARGGGGGSSGGGGGGGGGIIMVGYLPMHALGAWFRRIHKKYEALYMAMQFISWLTTVTYMVLLVVLLRGLGFWMAVGAPLGMGMGLYGWFGKLTQSKKTKAALTAAAAQDGAWDEAKLTTRASEVFMKFQKDWSDFDTEAMKAYMTPRYQYHNALMMYGLQLAGRRNIVDSPQISQTTVMGVADSSDNSKDTVVIGIQAQAHDQLIETADNKALFTDNNPFTEFWLFQRGDDGWRLDGIQQATASNWQRNVSLEQFATQNGYYFSLDMGWLMLPKRGQLFGDGKFGTSDINNHVIGMYKTEVLVQLYTYIPNPQNTTKSYLIAQANLPKSYGDIVVRRKQGLHLFGIKGLREVSTEWPDFNKKYQVYATSPEQATSLELLNPKYMEQLEAVPFEVNIEVVDNIVYLYTDEGSVVQPEHYQTMLNLLQLAFKEMRL